MSDEDQQVSGVNWGWFAILASIIAIVGGTTYFLLPSLISKTVTDITVVKAIDAPIKIKPLDPGGEVVDNKNLFVFNILKGENKADYQTETLRPTSPSPEPPPVDEAETAAKAVLGKPIATIEDKSKTDDKATANSGDEAAKKPLPKAKPVTELTTQTLAKTAASEGATGAETKAATSTKASSKRTKLAATKPVASKADRDTASKIKKRVIVIQGGEPLYMIQLAAFRNAEKATEIAKILSQKHKSRLHGVDLGTMSVDTGSNGIFYRIVSAPLPRPDADKICGVMRRSGQDCFLRKYSAPSP
ncbi:SPOR domain-containing protein [Alphaproteobacteria bacterium]|nr:SPOR domain-containing protein [Alphaproteobacteria bacterium]